MHVKPDVRLKCLLQKKWRKQQNYLEAELVCAAKNIKQISDIFEIHIQGKDSHSAYPHLAIDPINIGVHIYLEVAGGA